MSSLEVRGLEVRYGILAAVQGIDLKVDEGEIVVVLGANGAGKSSTLNAISGSVKPAAGEIIFNGQNITGWAAHKVARAGLVQVPEGRRIFGPLSVRENLILGGYGLARPRRDELVEQMFEMFPILAERKDGPAGLLSGGEQQMLAFGRALMSEPKILMLDEPSMGLAPVLVNSVMETVKRIADTGISILMVEQNAAAAFGVASIAYVLEQGEVTLHGPASQVAGDPLVLRAFLGLEEHLDDETALTTP